MRKKNTLAVISLACFGALLLAGCNFGGSSVTSSSEESKESQSSQIVSSSEKESSQEAHVHEFEFHAQEDATCLKAGKKAYYTCKGCDKVFDADKKEVEASTLIIAKLDHSLEHTARKEAGCTTDGNIEYWQCSACKTYFKDQAGTEVVTLAETVIDPVGHSGAKQDGQAATCTAVGWKDYYYCAGCQKNFSDADCEHEIEDLAAWKLGNGKLDKIAHNPTLVAGQASSCTEHGWNDYYQCSCGALFSDAEGLNAITDLAAWKSGAGQKALVAHTAQKQNGQAPTCKVAGWKDYYKCGECQLLFSDEACSTPITNLEAWKTGDGKRNIIAHDAELKAGQAATCTADGWKDHYECKACHDKWSDQALTTPIDNLDNWKTGAGKLAATGHKHLTEVKKVDESCTVDGVKAYYACDKGDAYFEDAEGTKPIADLAAWKLDGGKIAAHEHTFGTLIPQVDKSRDQDGMKAHYVCSECSGFFDDQKKSVTEASLKIANTYGKIEAGKDSTYYFKTPHHFGDKITVDFKINETSGTWLKVSFMDNTWSNKTKYVTLLAEGVAENSPAGVKVSPLLNDDYFRVEFDTSAMGIDGTLDEINFMYIWGANTNANGSFEYDPVGGTKMRGTKFVSGGNLDFYNLGVDVNTTLINVDVYFNEGTTTNQKINISFLDATDYPTGTWDHYAGYFGLKTNTTSSDFNGVTVTKLADNYIRYQFDFTAVNKFNNGQLKDPDFDHVTQLYVRGGWTDCGGYIDVNPVAREANTFGGTFVNASSEWTYINLPGKTVDVTDGALVIDVKFGDYTDSADQSEPKKFMFYLVEKEADRDAKGDYWGYFALKSSGDLDSCITRTENADGSCRFTIKYSKVNRYNYTWTSSMDPKPTLESIVQVVFDSRASSSNIKNFTYNVVSY